MARLRQVFGLVSDHKTPHFPAEEASVGERRFKLSLTAAGQPRIFTGFPLPLGLPSTECEAPYMGAFLTCQH